MSSITAKLANMRREVEWTIYPPKDNTVIIQSNCRIAKFDLDTGEGVISAHRATGAYFAHLSTFLGAKPLTVPDEVLEDVKESLPQSGDVIGKVGDAVVLVS